MKFILITISITLMSTAAIAGPGDGPVIDAGDITIRGEINGEIKNGRQGGGGSVSVLWGLGSASGGANATPGGRINVNGIVQEGQSLLKAHSIVLDTRLNRDITNNAGDITVSGITQIGK
jgi:type 1 fimbria pilin